jgi:hypothetical protein
MEKIVGFLVLAVLFVCCDPDEVVSTNKVETVTNLTYTLTPIDGGEPVLFIYSDKDGPGGNIPTISGGTIENNKIYTGKITMLDETKNPTVSISEEVQEEGLDHQMFFSVTQGLLKSFSIGYTDKDANGKPIGLTTEIATKEVAKGSIIILLKHLPNKGAEGVMTGDVTRAGGENDIEVPFPFEIK